MDGWHMIYVDSDNGLSALRRAFGDNAAKFMERVHYFGTEQAATFLEGMTERAIFRWNETQDKEYSSVEAKPGDRIAEIKPGRIPRNMILAIDSWSAVALSAMMIGAENKKTELERMAEENKSQAVYGDAGIRLTKLLAVIQHAPFHVIVQAHPIVYEKLEKPINKLLKEVKQSEMMIRDTIEIPLSSSRPHGNSMGKFFNEIGWIELNNMHERVVDFTQYKHRISGGTLNAKGTIGEMSWNRTFGKGKPPLDYPEDSTWIRYLSHEEFLAERPANAQQKPAGAPAVVPAKPVNPMMSMLAKSSA